MVSVTATREGLVGQATASGYVIDRAVPFVALPSTRALGRVIRLRNPKNGLKCLAVVLDVGPWNTADHAYVTQPATDDTAGLARPVKFVHPTAETGVDEEGRVTNKAGIDLGEKVWHMLGMNDNGPVEWEFVDA